MTLGAAWSGPLTGLGFVGGLGGAMARSEYPYPRPGSSTADTRRYFGQRSGAPWISVAGQLVSTAALARFTPPAARYAAGAGGRSARLRAMALAGGGLAVASLATAALTAAALAARRGNQDQPVALARRAFIAGGPIHGVGFGLLVGTVALAGLRDGALPRPLVITGLVSAGANLLSPLYLLAEPAGWLIPIGRFSGYVVIGLAGPTITRRAG